MRHLHRCPRCGQQHSCGLLSCATTPEHADVQRHGVTHHGELRACTLCWWIVLGERIVPFNRVERCVGNDGSTTLVCDVDGEPLITRRL